MAQQYVNNMNRLYYYIGGIALAVVVSGALTWFVFKASPQSTLSSSQPSQSGGFNDINNATQSAQGLPTHTNAPLAQPEVVSTTQKIFKISSGPIAGATFIQSLRPTTTVARFITADKGHVFDLVLDSQGSIPKSLSNTTIPGAANAVWAEKGTSVILQYIDGTTPKTLYLSVATTSASTTAPRLQFYPDGIVTLAVSPDGASVSYVLRTDSGIDGYISRANGSGGKKLFSLPLSQVEVRWPSQSTLLVHSRPAAGVPGIAFSVDVKTGSVAPLVYAPGLSATADVTFSNILIQTSEPGASMRNTYVHNIKTGVDQSLSWDPYPEKCVQSPVGTSTLVCAVPLSYQSPNYLDGWHQGTASAPDSILGYNLAAATSFLLASPGSAEEGGALVDIASLAVSPDGKYILYISKFDRSLWGVRLGE